MNREQIAALRQTLLDKITDDPDELTRVASVIQKLAKYAPKLTELCDFNQGQRMRRLLIIRPQVWTMTEARWTEVALKRIAELEDHKGDQATLALACFGCHRPDLEKALAKLEAAKRQEDAKRAKEREGQAGQAVQDDELDQGTLAALKSLELEAQKLK